MAAILKHRSSYTVITGFVDKSYSTFLKICAIKWYHNDHSKCSTVIQNLYKYCTRSEAALIQRGPHFHRSSITVYQKSRMES